MLEPNADFLGDRSARACRPVKDANLVTRFVAGETLIVPIRQQVASLDSIYVLNGSGAFIWEQINGGTTVAEVIAAVQAEFDGEAAQSEADTLEFLRHLQSAGLIAFASVEEPS
jgi:hypothetical protein